MTLTDRFFCVHKNFALTAALVCATIHTLAARESNKTGFVGQISSITTVLFLTIYLYGLRKEPCPQKNLFRQNCATPHGEFVFDEFWWDFAKQGVYLASESAPKDAKTNHREAISFGSRAATQKILVLLKL